MEKAKLTVEDLKRLEEIWEQVEYEAKYWPYDRIKWYAPVDGLYQEVLRRFYDESTD